MPGRAGGYRPSLPPAKITNHLVAMIEKPLAARDALPNISDAERIFCRTSDGTHPPPSRDPLAQLKSFVDQEFAQINMSRMALVCWGSARIASTLR